MISPVPYSILLTAWIITHATALLVPLGSASSYSSSITSSSTNHLSNSSSTITLTTSSLGTSLISLSSPSTSTSTPSSSSSLSSPSSSSASLSKHIPVLLVASPAGNAQLSRPSTSGGSSASSSSSSSSISLGPSSGFRSPSRPNHRISSGVFPPAPKATGTNPIAAPSGKKANGPFPVYSHGASGGSPSVSANATTAAPNEWPSGVPRGTSVNTITKVPAPIGYDSQGDPLWAVNETLPNNYASGILSLSYGMGNCSMSPGFDGYNAKSCSCVNRIGKWYHDFATATVTTTSCLTAYDPMVATDVQQLGCVPQTVTELSQQYTAPADCCDKCGIVGSAVRLLYWPPQTASLASVSGAPANHANVTAPPVAAASFGSVSDGMTFISPSVYVVYTDIKATASCVARVNSQVPLGPVHSLVTRAYAPDALMTARCQAGNLGADIAYCVHPVGAPVVEGDCFEGTDQGWAPINYAELADPPPDSVIYERKRSCFPSQTESMDVGFLKSIFLNPQLSFPADVSDIDPMWKTWGGNTCTAVNLGVADPPRALGQATALSPEPAQQVVDGSPHGCIKCPIGPVALSQAAELVPTATPMVQPLGLPAAAKQSPASPYPQQTPAPVFQNNPAQAPAQPVDDPIVASPQQASAVPDSAGSSPNPAPAPAPAPTAITLQPQSSAPQQAVVHQNNPSIGQAVNEGVNNAPFYVNNDNPPANRPITTDAVPLVAAVPSINVGGQPVFQYPGNNIVVAGSTIPPGSTALIAGHAVSNGVDSVVIDGSTQAIAPTPAAAGSQGLPIVDNQPVQKQQNGNLVVGGSITVPPGVQTNIAGQQISNGASQVEVNGQTFAAAPAQTAAPLLSNGGIVHMTNGGLELGSQTLIPGSQVTLSGQVVNYANPSQVIVDGTTHNLAAISSAQPLVIGGQTLSRTSNGGVIIAGSTVTPGGVATVNGHTFSLVGSSSIIQDGLTYSIPPTSNAYVVEGAMTGSSPLPTGPMTLANGIVVTPEVGAAPGANPTFRMPNGAEISAGGSAAVISGTTYSALPSDEGFLINGKSIMALPLVTAGAAGAAATPAVYTIGGQVFTANPTGFDIGSATVAPGGTAVTISGTVISLDKSSHLRIGTSTMDLSSEYPVPTNDVVSIDGTAVTAAPTGFMVDGTSIVPGGSAVTINGTGVSLDKSSHLVVGSSTMLLTGSLSANATATSGRAASSTGPTPAGIAGAARPLPTTGTHSGAGKLGGAISIMTLVIIGELSIMLNM